MLLFFRTGQVDGTHGKANVNAKECTKRSIGAGQLHRDKPEQLLRTAPAAVPLQTEAADIQFLECRQQLEWKSILCPVFIDNGIDLFLHERTNLFQEHVLFGVERLTELVEIAVW